MKPHVALIVETSSIYGREVLAGVMRFTRSCEDWSIFLQQRDLFSLPPDWLQSWSGQGIISRLSTPELRETVVRAGVPMVELTDRFDGALKADIRSDDEAIGRMAAEHLLQRGFQSFGFCGFENESWSQRRCDAFVGHVKQRGFRVEQFASPWINPEHPWEDDRREIAEWIAAIPRPCGIMACNDLRGHQVLQACTLSGQRVPEEIAVIGVDNDELVCQFCQPPLSSVVPNAERVGFEAAVMLSKLMNGGPSPDDPLIIPPVDIITRLSTDVVAIDHAEVAAALAYIRENACRGLTVDKVLENVAVSRSTLERQLRKHLGRTPQQEIRNVQLRRVRELLVTTDLSAEQIAYRAGFDHPEYMHYVFKRVVGMTPGQYRQSVRIQSETAGVNG
ncbi:MAG: DNA-binding transcriptional regulator [Planctomycetota bacterium]